MLSINNKFIITVVGVFYRQIVMNVVVIRTDKQDVLWLQVCVSQFVTMQDWNKHTRPYKVCDAMKTKP